MKPLTLDPTIVNDLESNFYIGKIFSGLMLFGTGWEVIPEVAQSWEVSEDGRRYVFHLRNDVFWSDGTQVTAEDFVYAMKRTLNPSTGAPPGAARLLYDIKGARDYHMGEVSAPDQVGVRVIDALTLEYELEKPASYFLHVLANLFPVPRHVVEAHGDAWTEVDNIVTNGPFQLESYQPSERINLVRNPSYHGRFSGNLQRVEVKLNINHRSSEELEIYESNGVDFAELGVEAYQARDRYAEEYISEPSPSTYYVRFDTSRPPFDDSRVRRAFVMAVDRERLADEVMGGFLYPATGGFVPPGIPGHSPGIGLPYDPVQARQLLTQAGYPDGRNFPNLELAWFAETNWIEHLAAEWLDNLNVEVTFKKIDRADFFQNIRKWNLTFTGWVADHPDPDNFLRVGFRSRPPYWRNEVYERLLEEAQRSSKLNDRIRLYQKADKILIEEAAIMPITYIRWHRLVKPWVKMPAESLSSWTFKDIIIEPH
jgi:oligopeptide transport system substrate-binding protein